MSGRRQVYSDIAGEVHETMNESPHGGKNSGEPQRVVAPYLPWLGRLRAKVCP
jgi:hypothetical protein